MIQGTSFGTKSQGAPLLWNPMDGESAYSSYSNGQALPKAIGPWPGTSGTAYFKTSNPRGKWTAKYSNSPNTSGYAPGNGQAAVGNKGFAAQCAGGKFYLTWWMNMSFNSLNASGSDKFFRLTENGPWVNTTFIWQPNEFFVFTNSTYNFVKFASWYTYGSFGSWNRMEALVDNHPSTYPTGRPQVKLWVNGQLLGDITAGIFVDTYGNLSTSVPYDICGIGNLGFDASNGDGVQPIVDFGEIYVDNTPQRVEICNANTKVGSNHCEIQIPVTWADSSVTVKVNQGSFMDNSSAYLYVIDSSGNPSTGKQITFVSANGAPDTISTLTKTTVSPN
jgi:hypothetical protein